MATPQDFPEVLERFHSHLDLVDLVARQLVRELGRAAELDDLRAMGHQGLLEAARRFDEGRGVTFRRFANYRVRGAMLDGVRKSAPMPRRAHARVRALEAALLLSESAAEDAAGSPAQANPDAAAMEQKLTAHLADMATAMAVGLLATPVIGEEGELSALETSASPEEAVGDAELRRILVEALEDLPEDERTLHPPALLRRRAVRSGARPRSGSEIMGEPAAHSCSGEVDQEASVAGTLIGTKARNSTCRRTEVLAIAAPTRRPPGSFMRVTRSSESITPPT